MRHGYRDCPIRDLFRDLGCRPRFPLDSSHPRLPVARRKILLCVDQPRDDYLWGEGWMNSI